MPDQKRPRILNVGQCGPDHRHIAAFLRDRLQADVDQAHRAEEAFALVASDGYDLVLVNRLFDADGSSGIEFIKRLTADERTCATPTMLVSNHDDAQDAAVEAGAIRGFGKAQLHLPATADRIAGCVGR